MNDAFLRGYADAVATMINSLNDPITRQLLVLTILDLDKVEMRLTTKEIKSASKHGYTPKLTLQSMLDKTILEANR